MRKNIKVLHETETGLNDRLSINGKTYTNNEAYRAAKDGKLHNLVGVQNSDGSRFVRSKPDHSKTNNIEN